MCHSQVLGPGRFQKLNSSILHKKEDNAITQKESEE